MDRVDVTNGDYPPGAWEALRGLAEAVERHLPSVARVRVGSQSTTANTSDLTATVFFRRAMAQADTDMDDNLVGGGVYQVAFGIVVETTASDPAVADERIVKAIDEMMALRRNPAGRTLSGRVPRSIWSGVTKETDGDGESYLMSATMHIDAAVRYS